jgi:aminopeptidase-like protein
MSQEQKGNKAIKFDRRLQELMIGRGQMTADELKKHLESLPDLKDKVDLTPLADEKLRSESH